MHYCGHNTLLNLSEAGCFAFSTDTWDPIRLGPQKNQVHKREGKTIRTNNWKRDGKNKKAKTVESEWMDEKEMQAGRSNKNNNQVK